MKERAVATSGAGRVNASDARRAGGSAKRGIARRAGAQQVAATLRAAASGASLVAALLVALAAIPRGAAAVDATERDDVVATFSIAAFDSATGDLGVAVASRVLAVGVVVPWAQAGVGAVATQALANPTFGPRGLSLLTQGKSAREALDLLVKSDAERERRQAGIVDAQGGVAAFTGTGCQPWAGSVQGKNYTAQGNILTGEEVVRAMGDAFEKTEGSLSDRLMAALAAGEAAGGDSRGRQSAAILVVRPRGGYNGMNDRYLDLRVDDHPAPIEELGRIYAIWRLGSLMQEAFAHYERKEWSEAIAIGDRVVAKDPSNAANRYNVACFYALAGRSDEALAHLEAAIAGDFSFKKLAAGDADFASLHALDRWKALVETP
jgi:uncharacterized Ntn-hydrolase superfamily protein